MCHQFQWIGLKRGDRHLEISVDQYVPLSFPRRWTTWRARCSVQARASRYQSQRVFRDPDGTGRGVCSLPNCEPILGAISAHRRVARLPGYDISIDIWRRSMSSTNEERFRRYKALSSSLFAVIMVQQPRNDDRCVFLASSHFRATISLLHRGRTLHSACSITTRLFNECRCISISRKLLQRRWRIVGQPCLRVVHGRTLPRNSSLEHLRESVAATARLEVAWKEKMRC